MTAHLISVYLCDDKLYVQPSLPTRRGMQALDHVSKVVEGWHGLSVALLQAKQFALNEAKKKPSARRYSDGNLLVQTAGYGTYTEFSQHSVVCLLYRLPENVLVGRMVWNPKIESLYGTERQDELPSDTPLEKLADIAKAVIEGKEGW